MAKKYTPPKDEHIVIERKRLETIIKSFKVLAEPKKGNGRKKTFKITASVGLPELTEHETYLVRLILDAYVNPAKPFDDDPDIFA